MKTIKKLLDILGIRQAILVKLFVDLFLWTNAALLAYYLRLEGAWNGHEQTALLYALIGMVIKAWFIINNGFHRQSWHKVGVRDLYSLLRSIILVVLIFSSISFIASPLIPVPRSIPLLDGLIAIILLGGVRLTVRALYEWEMTISVDEGEAKRVLIIGAGEAGTMIARDFLRHPEQGYYPIGFLDDNANKIGETYFGLPVFDRIKALPRIARLHRIDELLIAFPSAPGEAVRRVVLLAQENNIPHKIMPAFHEIASGLAPITQIREVGVDDLLRREPVQLRIADIAGYLNQRVVLVTGAGGSIGSEIVRQVVNFKPKQIILLGRGENSLFHLEREVRQTFLGLNYEIIVGNVQNREKIERVFQTYHPQIVFHAAAHKHVPLMESNPDEAIINNVSGTKNVVEMSLKYDVERFVNISTDKAVRPSNIMGVSKRLAEMVVLNAAQNASSDFVYVSVRFGNVLGSRGSVVPIFKEQIRNGGPVTVTHPEMTRYFMTIPEATQLVLQAGGMSLTGAIYVLNMGQPMKILDLAEDLIQLSGLKVDEDIKIVFTGIRPGEKLHEKLLSEEEDLIPSSHEKIMIVKSVEPLPEQINTELEQLIEGAYAGDYDEMSKELRKLIPNFELKKQKGGDEEIPALREFN